MKLDLSRGFPPVKGRCTLWQRFSGPRRITWETWFKKKKKKPRPRPPSCLQSSGCVLGHIGSTREVPASTEATSQSGRGIRALRGWGAGVGARCSFPGDASTGTCVTALDQGVRSRKDKLRAAEAGPARRLRDPMGSSPDLPGDANGFLPVILQRERVIPRFLDTSADLILTPGDLECRHRPLAAGLSRGHVADGSPA